MGLADYWRSARRGTAFIVAGLVVGVAGAAGYSATIPIRYTASSTMYVSMATGTSVNDSYQGGLAAQQRTRSYLELARSAAVAQRVVTERGLTISPDALRARITTSSPPATALLQVSVSADTAAGARDLTDAVVAQFRQLVDQLETIESTAAPAARVAVVDKAELPASPSSPSRAKLLVLGAIAGLILGFGAAVLRQRFDGRLYTVTELAAAVAPPVLGTVDDRWTGASMRGVRSALGTTGRAPDTILVTALSGASRPDIARDLARSFADTGARVVYIDADTTAADRSPASGGADGPGLADLLRNPAPAIDAVRWSPDTDIGVLPLGAHDRQTTDLFASARMIAILLELRGEFDQVIVGAAAVDTRADAFALAPHCAGTVGIAELGAITGAGARRATAALARAGGTVAGVIAIRTRPRRRLSRGRHS